MPSNFRLWTNGLEEMKKLFRFLTVGVPNPVRGLNNVMKIEVLFKRFKKFRSLYKRIPHWRIIIDF
jgi:hypothetical protein